MNYPATLGVVARNDPPFFREIMNLSLSAFATAKETYHISADPSRIPRIESVSDKDLAELVERHDSRQVLHVGYGDVLDRFGDKLKGLLASHEQEHYAGLASHLGRHLQGLEVSNERV